MLLCEQPTIDLIQTIFQNSGMSGTTENKDKVTQDGKDLLRDCLTEFILFISEDAGNNAKNRVSNEATEKGKIRTNTDLMLKNNKILDSLPQSITNLKFTESQIARSNTKTSMKHVEIAFSVESTITCVFSNKFFKSLVWISGFSTKLLISKSMSLKLFLFLHWNSFTYSSD
jgi:hypothetical protein